MKKHYYSLALVIFLVALAALYVGATGYAGGKSHTTLFTDTIRGKSADTVLVNDYLTVKEPGAATAQKVCLEDGTNCQYAGQSCPDSEHIAGFNADGTLICS